MENLLEGVRVLDLTRVLAGPYASMVLADLGAEVIKVELPGQGDEARTFGPFQNGESAYFTSVNRGKKSITIDLRKERGQELARQLAGACDVLVENFRPGSMARFGLDYRPYTSVFRVWSTPRSRDLARRGPMRSGRPTTSSSRPWAGSPALLVRRVGSRCAWARRSAI